MQSITGFNDELSVGQWVTLRHSKGVWKIYRIAKDFNEIRFSLATPKERSRRTLIFVRRLWTSSINRIPAFRNEVCEKSLARPASNSEQIEDCLRKNENLRRRFETYAAKPVNLVVNILMQVPEIKNLELFCAEALSRRITKGLAIDQVLELLEERGMISCVGKNPINSALQLICQDHELQNDEFIARDCRVLKY